MTKAGGKKKEAAGKSSVSQFLRSTDDEIKAELEAMTNLEYNLHSDYEMTDYVPETPLFTVKKSRGSKDSSKQEKASKHEKMEAEGHSQTYIPTASTEELHAIIRQAASSSEEKYKILDARDRLMRLKQAKSQNVSLSKTLRGICPDMCPEKERLMREFQRQVASYELLEGATDYRIDHATAVKQYSRSSADQEEPMPQDLRPVASLRMTMSYLLHEIADLCEAAGTNLAEWYHFLWDRTRGIRKDITQQELSCAESVHLVEQCARFHIFCAERLCAEEVSVFDKKINTENLTKCLQTLKYMYNDLRLKGVICENEPEFRAYVVLLNLNTGNFMWDVRRLPVDVRRSPQVKFAIEAHLTLASNNYAKFFQLVRETNYLNACILLRYFNQVRTRALAIMVKAYCRTKSTAFPLYELIDILGFEDENEAVYFAEQCGLNLSDDELHVMLDRSNFSQPINVEQGRAHNNVGSKRQHGSNSIGLCIAGGEMPEKTYVNHRPHDSFDSEGFLKQRSIKAEDQIFQSNDDPYEFMEEETNPPATFVKTKRIERIDSGRRVETKKPDLSSVFKMPFACSTPSMPPPTHIFAKPANSDKVDFSSILTKSKAQEIQPEVKPPIFPFATVEPFRENRGSAFPGFPGTINEAAGAQRTNIFEKTSSIKKKSIPAVKRATEASSSIFGKPSGVNLFGNTSAPNVPMPVKKAAPPRVPDRSIGGNIFESPAHRREEAAKAKQQKEAIERAEMMEKVDQASADLLEIIEREVMEECCMELISEEMDRQNFYADLSKNIYEEILEDIIEENCRKIVYTEIKSARRMEELEQRAKNRLIEKYFKKWRDWATNRRRQRTMLDVTPVWLQKRSIDECAKSLFRKDRDLVIRNMRRKRRKVEEADLPLEYLQPIETRIHDGLRENAAALGMDLPRNSFWKMIISWPSLENRRILSRQKKIMNQYISPSDYNRFPIVKSYRPNSRECVHICVKNFEHTIQDRQELMGSDGLFFIAGAAENPKSIARRLSGAIVERDKFMPIPVLVAIFGEDDFPARRIKLNDQLDVLSESGYVSEYTIRYEDRVDEQIILDLTQKAVAWLTINKSPAIPLEMDFLSRVCDTCLTEELWLRVLGHSPFNKQLGKALEDIYFVIDLHNEAVTHLMDILLDPESLMYTDFPPEFKHFLPKNVDLPCTYEHFDRTWKSEETRANLEEIMNHLSMPKWTFGWPILDKLELQRSIARYCQQSLMHLDDKLSLRNVLDRAVLNNRGIDKTNFVEILLEILREKIRHIEPRVRVVYNKNHVRHFRDLPWWFKSSALMRRHETRTPVDVKVPSPKRMRVEDESESFCGDMTSDDIEEISKNYESIYQEKTAVEDIRRDAKSQASLLRDMSEKIEKMLLEQKNRSLMLEAKLSLALEEPQTPL